MLLSKMAINYTMIKTNYSNYIDFYKNKLKLNQNMFLNINQSKKILINETQEAIKFLICDLQLHDLKPKLNKLIRIVLIIPISPSIAERFFSLFKVIKRF